jgi:hypothetical protein
MKLQIYFSFDIQVQLVKWHEQSRSSSVQKSANAQRREQLTHFRLVKPCSWKETRRYGLQFRPWRLTVHVKRQAKPELYYVMSQKLTVLRLTALLSKEEQFFHRTFQNF